MPEFPRNLPHLYLRGSGKPEPYMRKPQPQEPASLPHRDRTTHAEVLRVAMIAALAAAAERRAERDPAFTANNPGFYLDVEIPAGSEQAAERLENRRKHIDLVAFRQDTGVAIATVFVPDSAAGHFLKKIAAYQTENTSHGRPKNEPLIARVQNFALAAVQSVFTDDPALFPTAGQQIWWEIWIRQGYVKAFDAVARHFGIPIPSQVLSFPDRDVRLLYGDEITVARLFLNSDAIAEVRRAKDTPALFMDWSNVEQADWSLDLAGRLVIPTGFDVAVCILDTGITQAHPLLRLALDPSDVHAYDPTWPGGDARGHGTNMAGTALYGDLMPILADNAPVRLTHCLESVKILPDQGENEPRLYGWITGESIARAEINAPERRRAFCMAVTSDIGTNRGRPTSWSAAIDQLCFGDETISRLILVSAGNVRTGLSKAEYPARNDSESIENPAQAWNAVCVGAYTEKLTIVDPSYAGWEPLAPAGDLCPTSRTSLLWEQKKWPIKPDIVLEGGNCASLGEQCARPDDLGILTTYRDPTVRHFDIFGDTSAATAAAGHLAGRIMAAMPERWPETIRAMIVHSAEWTPVMKQQFESAVSKQQRHTLLRKYGYGVPQYERAVLSAANDLTLIAEDELQPLRKDGIIKSCHMNLHQFPWPRTELEQLGETEVEIRVTLSYFVEPNPGERGWLRRHSYPSHGLRFALKRSLESVDAFRTRINGAAAAEEGDLLSANAGQDNWYLGKIRDKGSIHSDYCRGTAVELARRSAVGVFPIGGWWKENSTLNRFDRTVRYSLIVSIRAGNGTVDIYTPVSTQITAPVDVTV